MNFGCFFCGCPSCFSQFPILLIDSTSVKTSEPSDKFKHWRKSWGISLSKALDLEYASFERTFASARFCLRCQELVCHADFTVNAISKLNVKLQGIQELLNRMLRERFKILVARGADKNESHLLSIGNIIRTFDSKTNADVRTENQFVLNDSRDKRLQRLQQLKQRQANIIKSRARACKTLNRKEKKILKEVEIQEKFKGDSCSEPVSIEDEGESENLPKLVLVDDGCKSNTSSQPIQDVVVSPKPKDGGEVSDYANSNDADYTPEQESEDDGSDKSKTDSDDDFTAATRYNKGAKLRKKRKMAGNGGQDQTSKRKVSKTSRRYSSLKVPCPYCTKKYETEGSLSFHILRKHKSRRYDCVYCDAKHVDRHDYLFHLNKAHSEQKTHQCPTCDKIFFFGYELTSHSRIHSKDWKSQKPAQNKNTSGGTDVVYTCPVEDCKISFTNAAGLKAHVHYLHPTDFKCPFPGCGKRFALQRKLNAHSIIHPTDTGQTEVDPPGGGDKEIQNVHDQATAISNDQTQSTTNSTLDESNIFRCYVCGETCLTNDILQNHIEKEHGISETPENVPNSKETNVGAGFECRICGINFKDEVKMRRHYFVHDKKKEGIESPFQFRCPECPKRCATEKSLTAHIKFVHRGALRCEICDKTCSKKSDLTRHMLTHSDTRDHICDTCGKQYKKRDSLRRHIRVDHAKELKFPCSACDKVFGRAYFLRCHQVRQHGMIASAELSQVNTST